METQLGLTFEQEGALKSLRLAADRVRELARGNPFVRSRYIYDALWWLDRQESEWRDEQAMLREEL